MPSKHDLQIEDEALAWLIRVSSGEMTLQQEQSLNNWLNGNPAHRLAYAEAQALWQGIGQLQGQPIVADNLAKMKAERESHANSTAHSIKPSAYAKHTFPFSQLMLMAASLAMVALLCPTMTSSLQLWNADYQTAIGEQQAITLEDGSKLYLNAASALNVNYSPQQRRLELLAGEVEFEVSKDAARPFVVEAKNQEIKALGTDFVVKLTDNAIKVGVVESAVQVSQSGQSNIAPVTVHTGEQINIPAGQGTGPVTAINIHHASPWRSNKLIFESEPLAQVVDDINRFRPGHVFLSHPSLRKLRVSGVFNLDEIDTLLAVINKTLPIKSVALSKRFVVLY